MRNRPFPLQTKAGIGNREWVRGYTIGQVIDNISDGMLPPSMHNMSGISCALQNITLEVPREVLCV